MNEQSYELMVNCAKGAVMGKNALNSMANYVSGEEARRTRSYRKENQRSDRSGKP